MTIEFIIIQTKGSTRTTAMCGTNLDMRDKSVALT